jgi:hypothetical protein
MPTAPSFDALDTLVIAGLLALSAGVALEFGVGYAVIVIGAVLTLIGAVALFVRRAP